MKVISDTRLFWFLKDGIQLDLSIPSTLDMYVQQVVTHGKFEDIKKLLKDIERTDLKESFKRIKPFLAKEVRMFWEDYFAAAW